MAPMAGRRYGTIVRHLTEDPETAVELAQKLPDEVLAHVAAAIRDETRRRAVDSGDRAAVVADAFEQGFGRDGLGTSPWISGSMVVCPGSIVAKNRANHRCRFVSVDDVWIWDSVELIEEEKRSHPGADHGFKAVALLSVIEGLALDVVTGRARSGQHSVEHVVSFEIRKGALVEVSQRDVNSRGMQ